jgi:hypothetical protein
MMLFGPQHFRGTDIIAEILKEGQLSSESSQFNLITRKWKETEWGVTQLRHKKNP